MQVHVDPSKCQGHALCIARAPEGFDFIDLEDRAVVIEAAVTANSANLFRAAAIECPEQAIIIEGDHE